MCVCVCVYIYIYIEREREREDEETSAVGRPCPINGRYADSKQTVREAR